MKKTLIALAAVVATGAAFAQSSVNLTGKLRFAYEFADAAGPGGKANGIGVTDGDWNIGVVEDLGGGMKAGANMALRLRGRDAATDGASTGLGARPRDSSMYLSGGFGTVLVGAIETGNGILPLVTAGGPTYYGLDNGAQLAGASNSDILQYTSPAIMPGLTARVATLDTVGANGAQSTATTQDANLIGVNYAAGNLSVAADFTTYGMNAAVAPGADSRTRLSANYNFGVARVGLGYQTAEDTANVSKNEFAIGVSMPFDAWVVGAVYASSKTEGVAGNNTGVDFAAQYNLSKRTYLALQYQTTKAAGAADSANKYRVQIAHSF